MSEHRKRDVEQRIKQVEAELSEVRQKIQGLSIDSSDNEVADCQRLQSARDLKLSLGRAELEQLEERQYAIGRAEEDAERQAATEAARERERLQKDKARILELERIIADPNLPRLTDEELASARTMGLGAEDYMKMKRAPQRETWQKDLEKLEASVAEREASEAKPQGES